MLLKSTLGTRTDRLIPQSPTSALTKAPEGKINYERRVTSSSSLTISSCSQGRHLEPMELHILDQIYMMDVIKVKIPHATDRV